jgi:two-component system, NarL family, sensor histidine kinase UhpB
MLLSFTKRLKRTPIFYRLAIGNAVIIVLSAIVGTLLTHFLTDIAATLWHFVIFASIGIIISLVLNFTIIRLSLQPLHELRHIIHGIQTGQAETQQLNLQDTDPDIHKLTVALNSLISQLQQRNQQFRLLSERSIFVQEEERKRIARSLHDDTGQSLSTLMIHLDRLEKQVPPENEALLERLRAIRQMAAESLECLRSIIYDLRPAILDDLGLVAAIRWYARTNLEEAGINVVLDLPDDLPSIPPALSTTLFRVAQEGVNNIVRHSQAKQTTIRMGMRGNEVYLNLHDDGHGFAPLENGHAAMDLQHWGLVGIQERIELVGGRMSITTDPEHGTTLRVNAPLIKSELGIDG